PTKCYIVANVERRPRSKSAKPKPKPWRLWSANLSDFRTEPHPRTTSSFGTGTLIFCARAWKQFNKPLPRFSGALPLSQRHSWQPLNAQRAADYISQKAG